MKRFGVHLKLPRRGGVLGLLAVGESGVLIHIPAGAG